MLRRTRSRAAALAGFVLLASLAILIVARSGGTANPGVTHVGPTATATGQASSRSGSQQKSMIAFSACMRSHGLPTFPDPNSKAQLLMTPGSGIDPSSPQFQAAQQACQALQPQVSPGQGAQNQAKILKFAACMRSHGVPSFPDPNFSGGHFQLQLPQGIDPSSPQFQAAQQACQALAPFSGPGGGQ